MESQSLLLWAAHKQIGTYPLTSKYFLWRNSPAGSIKEYACFAIIDAHPWTFQKVFFIFSLEEKLHINEISCTEQSKKKDEYQI